ncbi:MAG: hypothetical protein GC154_09975 [bacterium]|nr:hypothetical protein [bacterium]
MTLHNFKTPAALIATMILTLFAGLEASAATQDPPPPPRVARLSTLEGSGSMMKAGQDDWEAVDQNTPIMAGDKLYTSINSRAEIQLGDDIFLRLNDQTYVTFPFLEDDFVRVEIVQGSVAVNALSVDYQRPPLEVMSTTFLATIDGTVNARFDVRTSGGAEISVISGNLRVQKDAQNAIDLQRGERLFAPTADPDTYAKLPIAPEDAFDKWNQARDAENASRPPVNYVSPRISGHRDLDQYGDWVTVPSYGRVWRPTVTVSDWAPYRYGYWDWRPLYGWTWVSYEPWGWAPYHYGRWVYVDRYNWCWVPTDVVYIRNYYTRPYWYPALVSFSYYNDGSYFSVGFGRGYRGSCYGWFPLSVHDPYYWNWGYYNHHRDRYWGGNQTVYNGDVIINNGTINYGNINSPNAVTVMPASDFRDGSFSRKAAATRTASAPRASVVGPAAMNELPDPQTVMTETRKTRLAMKDSSGVSTSSARAGGNAVAMANPSSPGGAKQAMNLAEAKPARVREAAPVPQVSESRTLNDRVTKLAARSTVETSAPRSRTAIAASEDPASSPRAVNSPARVSDGGLSGNEPRTAESTADRGTVTASPSRTVDRSTARPSQPDAIRTRSARTPADAGSDVTTSSPRRVESAGRGDANPATSPSRVSDRSPRVTSPSRGALRSAAPSNTSPGRDSTQPGVSTQPRVEPLDSIRSRSPRTSVSPSRSSTNWAEPGRTNSYRIETRPRSTDSTATSPSRSTTLPESSQRGVLITPRQYNMQSRGAYSTPNPSSAPDATRRYDSIPTSPSRGDISDRSPVSIEPRASSYPSRDAYDSSVRIESSPSRTYSAPSARSSAPSYETSPSRSFDVSPSRTYNAPSARSSAPSYETSPSRSFDVSPSRTYSAPSARSSAPSYETSPSRSSSRSFEVSPSRGFSAPSSRSSAPSIGTSPSRSFSSPSRSGGGSSFIAPRVNSRSYNTSPSRSFSSPSRSFSTSPSRSFTSPSRSSGSSTRSFSAPAMRSSSSVRSAAPSSPSRASSSRVGSSPARIGGN